MCICIPSDRQVVIVQLLAEVYANLVPGSTAELGVWKGGSSKLIAENNHNRTHYCYDTFEGIPNAVEGIDLHKNCDFNDTSLEAVTEFLKDCINIRICPGYFPSTAIEDNFCFVHLDADTYQSTKDGLTWFYPRLNPGGVIVLDDWEWVACPGVKVALLEFLAGKPENIESKIIYQAFFRKR